MNKQEFMAALERGLYGLPQDDVSERLSFYSEMIDDRIEEGFTEEAAVSAVGPVDAIVAQITSDIPLKKIVKEKVKTRQSLKTWEIILLVLGSPVWIPLLLAGLVIVLSLYIVIWAFVISFFAATLGLAVGCISGIVGIFMYAFSGNMAGAGASAGAAIACAGLAILLFLASVQIAKGATGIVRSITLGIKSIIAGREKQ